MGLSALAAILVLAMAFLTLSPGAARRSGLDAGRLGQRARSLVGYALALLLLVFGFFLAGVPLGERQAGGEPAVVVVTATPGAATAVAGIPAASPSATATAPSTPASGAFAGPPDRPATATPEGDGESPTTGPAPPTATPTLAATVEGAPTATGTPIPTPTATPTPTASPTATATPTPTMTPTPIVGETAIISASSPTLWLHRTPGGDLVVQVNNGDTVLLLPRRASYAGDIWQEISTLDGVSGWVREELLVVGP